MPKGKAPLCLPGMGGRFFPPNRLDESEFTPQDIEMTRKSRKPNPVRARREAVGMSGVELARAVGISASHLHGIETGETPLSRVRVDIALGLAEELGLDVRAVFPRSRAA